MKKGSKTKPIQDHLTSSGFSLQASRYHENSQYSGQELRPVYRVLGGEWDTPRLGGGLGAGSSVCIGAESERARGEAEKGGAAGKERVEGAKTSDDGRERVGGGDLSEGDIAPP